MNRMVSALDKYILVSNSDAHSPANLAREANIFDCGMDFGEIYDSINGISNKFRGPLSSIPRKENIIMTDTENAE